MATRRDNIVRSDFTKLTAGYGAYKVAYTSNAGRTWEARITDMSYIDAVWGVAEPTKKALKELRWAVKYYGERIA